MAPAGEGQPLPLRLAVQPEALEVPLPLAGAWPAGLAAWGARVGELLTVQAPDGRLVRARLLEGEGWVRPFAWLPDGVEPPQARRLLQAVPDRERMLWIIQKAVELGASEVQPVATERANAGPGDGPRQDKSATWGRVARTAARQCRRALIPPVQPVRPLAALLAERPAGERWLMLDWQAGQPLLELVPGLARQPLALLVGPEGGWSAAEQAALQVAGVTAVRLGPRLLRTETAAMAALALLGAGDGEFALPGS